MQQNLHLSLRFSYSEASALLFNSQNIAEAVYLEEKLQTPQRIFTDTHVAEKLFEKIAPYKSQISTTTASLSSFFTALMPTGVVQNEEQSHNILGFHYQNLKGTCTFDFVPSLQSTLCYAYYLPLANAIANVFPAVKMAHDQFVILESIARERRFTLNTCLYVFVEANNLSVYLFNNNNLLVFNQFLVQSADDITYYLLNICEAMHLNPKYILIKFLNHFSAEAAEKLKPFFPAIENWAAEETLIPNSEKIYLHLKQQKCVL
ncbi:MAG: DUF3822 family protein [Luteibaculaceae bacterium]